MRGSALHDKPGSPNSPSFLGSNNARHKLYLRMLMRLGEKFGAAGSRTPTAAGPVLKEVLDKHLQAGGGVDEKAFAEM